MCAKLFKLPHGVFVLLYALLICIKSGLTRWHAPQSCFNLHNVCVWSWATWLDWQSPSYGHPPSSSIPVSTQLTTFWLVGQPRAKLLTSFLQHCASCWVFNVPPPLTPFRLQRIALSVEIYLSQKLCYTCCSYICPHGSHTQVCGCVCGCGYASMLHSYLWKLKTLLSTNA